MLLESLRSTLARQPISAPTMAVGFMGGVVLPVLLTNAIVKNQPKMKNMSKAEKDKLMEQIDSDFNELLF